MWFTLALCSFVSLIGISLCVPLFPTLTDIEVVAGEDPGMLDFLQRIDQSMVDDGPRNMQILERSFLRNHAVL